MSRRAPNPAAERAAQNQATIKSLLKLEPNKVCADCKRNKYPRWASWNLGIFVCIRCSGIHRGMGTHISRVKSVDLDSWTDEQLQSILNWGNARANKYWEAKLAPGHAPSEAKIENFIRTKYELKRWVMDGPRPDPSTLDADVDDDVPLSLVKEKQAIEKESIRKASVGQSQVPETATSVSSPEGDLIGGGDVMALGANPSGGPTTARVSSKSEPVPPKMTNTKDSLLGLDFLGGGGGVPPRPSSRSGAVSPGGQSRPNLKQSILSLYASAPRPQPPAPQQATQRQGSFGGSMSLAPMGHQHQGSTGGLGDALGSLNISSKPRAADPFANLGSTSSNIRAASHGRSNSGAFGGLGEGHFFDAKPAQQAPAASHQPTTPADLGFGISGSPFSSPSATQSVTAPKPAQPSVSALDDLFDLSSPIPQSTSPPAQTRSSPSASGMSVFNLSATQSKATLSSATASATGTAGLGGAAILGADVWGGNEWSAPVTASAASVGPRSSESSLKPLPSGTMGWEGSTSLASTAIVPGSGRGFNPAPTVAQDEEFGGWTSSTVPTGTRNAAPAKPSGGFCGDDDLFSNVWQ